MDSSGRLHMPGFVGGTFDETGLTKKIAQTEARPAAVAEVPVSRQVRRALERAAVKRGGQQDRRQGVKA